MGSHLTAGSVALRQNFTIGMNDFWQAEPKDTDVELSLYSDYTMHHVYAKIWSCTRLNIRPYREDQMRKHMGPDSPGAQRGSCTGYSESGGILLMPRILSRITVLIAVRTKKVLYLFGHTIASDWLAKLKIQKNIYRLIPENFTKKIPSIALSSIFRSSQTLPVGLWS